MTHNKELAALGDRSLQLVDGNELSTVNCVFFSMKKPITTIPTLSLDPIQIPKRFHKKDIEIAAFLPQSSLGAIERASLQVHPS